MRGIAALVLVVTVAMAMPPPVWARSALQRDAESYAIASCLFRQREPLLAAQGDAWGDAIVQRSAGDIKHFAAITRAVDAALKRNPVAIGHDEATGKGKSMPVLLCGEIIDVPSVRAAINRAEVRLGPDYQRR